MRVVHNFLWWLPIKIMKSGVSLLNLERKIAAERMPKRHRPLHTCGASFLGIAQKAFTKIQDFDGPLGSIAKRAITLIHFFFPFVYTMFYQWLALISFMDDQILTVETIIESIFPPSTHLFDKIDTLVSSSENLPQQLDDIVLRKLPLMIHKFPFLDWIVFHLISWLNRLHSILTHFGSKNTTEKEIKIDMICNDTQSCKSSEIEKKSDCCCPVESLAIGRSDFSDEKGNANVVIQKSVDRLRSLRKSLDEPRFDTDSPMYSSYQSANRLLYKEMLERGRKTKTLKLLRQKGSMLKKEA
ncbi:hypothetical protein DH2020_003765 [Rehmannia glutinosa]|uniref:Uncharacterized protein n=1 Tax=Rehmannia glutinosa TaxID=99300 RepID=A0ABR0XMK6_REHGL